MIDIDLQQADPVLVTTLSAAVPLRIEEVRSWTWERRIAEAQACGKFIASHGDDLLYGGKHCAEAFNQLAIGLACLAYVPGGVKLFGLEFSA